MPWGERQITLAEADRQFLNIPDSFSANPAVEDRRLERQQHFALPTFILARRKNWAYESGRPLTEKRYSPYRPTAVIQALEKQTFEPET